MQMINFCAKVMPIALVAVSGLALLAAGYGYRTHEIAIRGWEAASQAQADLAEAKARLVRETTLLDLSRDALREMVRIGAGIQDGDRQTEVAKKITTHLYQSAIFTGTPWATSSNDALRYIRTVNQKIADMCATLASTEIWALALFDIQARPVSFAAEDFVSGKDIAPTHTLVEAMVDGSPLLFDPTFNAQYSCGNGPINAREMLECARDGNVRPIYLSTPRPGRSVEEYPFTFQEMSFAVEATASPDVFYTLELPNKGWLASARKHY